MIWAIILRQKRNSYNIFVFHTIFVCLGRVFSLANIQTDEARPPAADEGNFYNMVRVWYMVSETHTIFLKYKYGNNFTITIEKKILYGNQFSYHYHMKQYIVKIVTILPYNIYSGNILPTPGHS